MFAGQPFLFSKIQTFKKPLAMETAHPAQAAGSLRALRHGNIPAPVRDASVKGGLAQRVSSGQLDVSSKNWATRARSSGVEGSPCACSVNSGGDEHAPRRLSTGPGTVVPRFSRRAQQPTPLRAWGAGGTVARTCRQGQDDVTG